MSTPYADGPEDAAICVLAEAPSYMEMQEGRPLCGPAGSLFERCAHAAQIARAECRLLNVFETPVWKPKDDASKIYSPDKVTLWWSSGKGFTDAGRAASFNSLGRVRSGRWNVLAAMGGPALSLAVDNRPIGKWRGSILEGVDGRKIVPTFHPAYCLRGAYEARYIVVSDLKKVKAQSTFPEVRASQRNLIIDPTFEQCLTFLRRCLDAPAVNTDIEILGGQVDCFSLAIDPSEAISIPLLEADWEHRWSLDEERQIWELYARILSAPHIAKINQNISFDLAVLLQLNNLVPQGPLHDPMVAHSVLYPALKKDLGTLCSLYTDESYYKNSGALENYFDIEDFERRWIYSAKDSAVSLECWQTLKALLDEGGYRSTYDMTMAMVPSLVFMMVHGIRVDQTALQTTKEKAEGDLESLIARLSNVMGRPVITEAPKNAKQKKAAAGAINVNSPAQLSKYFYDELKLKAYTNSAGKHSIDDKALARIFRRDGRPEAKLLQEYRSLAKMLSTYLDMEFDEDERMRSSYQIRGTWTGRLSSNKTIFGRGANAQNLAPEFRNFLVVD